MRTSFQNHFLKGSVFLATAMAIHDSCSGQALYTANWVGTDISATATISINESASGGAATDGNPYVYGPSDFNTLWLNITSMTVTVTNGGQSSQYNFIMSNVDSLTWQSSSVTSPTQFFFDAESLPGGTWSITGSANRQLDFTLPPQVQGGSSTTYSMTQSGSFSAVPEPEEWAAIASGGLLAFGIWHRRSRKAKKA